MGKEIMKNNRIILAVLATSLLLGQPMVAQEQSKSSLVNRAKKKYREFREALKCVRQKGFRSCSSAEKKRIVVASVAVIAAIALTAGGIWWWRKRLQEMDQSGGKDYSWRQVERIIRGGNRNAVAQLIADGANVNHLLERAVSSAGSIDTVKFLLENGADINFRWSGRFVELTPLLNAVFFGRKEMARFLIEQGADVNAQDRVGRTPLFYAHLHKDQELANLLVAKGADPFIEFINPKYRGKGPRVMSEETKKKWFIRMENIVRELAEKGLPAEMIIEIMEKGRPQRFSPEVRREILGRIYHEAEQTSK